VPREVVRAARKRLAALEEMNAAFHRDPHHADLFRAPSVPVSQAGAAAHAEIIRRLSELDVDALSPREAHALLAALIEQLHATP
jgi:DNA mismatch repair protein MutS